MTFYKLKQINQINHILEPVYPILSDFHSKYYKNIKYFINNILVYNTIYNC